MSGMVAYTLMLSVFPFALVALFIAGRVLRSEELQASVLADLQRIFPTAAESTLSEGVRRLQQTSPTVGIVAVVGSIWFGSSFWGALDTAFCRIYHCECRPGSSRSSSRSACSPSSCCSWPPRSSCRRSRRC